MKFIGQYIQGFISRFRNTVFFETDTIMMSDLPTSDPGVAGQLWNDSGTVKVSS
jgi:hypothetical protein|tara:strand:+ start:561 stop:722 length:162 start_codon:yes stop_codon:yes gene_type:complete